MAAVTVAIERESQIAFVEETTENTLKAHTAGDFVRHAGGALSLPFLRQNDDDMDSTTALEAVTELGNQGNWSLAPAAVRPSGSDAGAAEMDPLLKGLMGTSSTPGTTTVNDAGATVVLVTLTSAAAYGVGDIVYFQTDKLVGLISAIAGNDVSFDPPLASAPANAQTVSSGKQFSSADVLPTFTMYVDKSTQQWVTTGVIVNEGTFDFQQNATVKASFGGPSSGKRSFAGVATLEAETAAVAVTTVLDDGMGAKFDVSAGAIDITFDKGNANEETVQLTAVVGDTLTHAAVANTHAIGVEVSPENLTPTHTGNQLSDVDGTIALAVTHNGATTRIAARVRGSSVSINNGYVRESDYGADHDDASMRQDRRESTGSITFRMDQDQMRIVGQAQAKVTSAILLHGNDELGDIFAVGMAKCVLDFPEMDTGARGHSLVTVNFRALAKTAAGNNEIRIATL